MLGAEKYAKAQAFLASQLATFPRDLKLIQLAILTRYSSQIFCLAAVLRIHFGMDPDPRICACDLWIRILLFLSLTFKMPTKN
jgi:hypothetical protein